jgi:DNA-directed RNA polymerase specialized sigma24 family protein
VAGGDDAGWHDLWLRLEPILLRMIAQPGFLGRVGQRIDDRRNILLEIMTRLRAGDRRRLRAYVAMRTERPELRFETWLRVVAKRVGIDYIRGHPDYIDRRRSAGAETPGVWVDAATLPPSSQLAGPRAPATARGTAQRLLRYAVDALPPQQVQALELWVQGESYASIARAIGLSGVPDTERMVRAAVERLRRRFREEATDE